MNSNKIKYFLDVFHKFNFSDNTIKTFKNVIVKNINFFEDKSILDIDFFSNEMISEVKVNYLKKEFKEKLFFLKEININIEYDILETSLENKIKSCWNNILYNIEQKSKICFIIIRNAKWHIEENKLKIKLDSNSIFLCEKMDISKLIKDYFFKNLKQNIIIEFESTRTNVECLQSIEKQEVEMLSKINNSITEKINSKVPSIVTTPRKRAKSSIRIIDDLKDKFSKLSEPLEKDSIITFKGKIFDIEIRESKNSLYIIKFDMTDGTDSITVKFFISPENYTDEYKSLIKVGNNIAVRGKVQFDEYSKELNIIALEIGGIKEESFKNNRADTCEEKRVELHLHTQMSSMDGISSTKNYIERAIEWGHKALAITDHGVVQAFPEAMEAVRNKDFKIIYGVEAYLVDDLGVVVESPMGQNFDDEFVVFDIETTGLNKEKDSIIEIGAVKIKNRKVVDKFSSFIDPKVELPKKIVELTGITDDMLKGQPLEKEVIDNFLNFIGNSVLVAHNANFDVSFISLSSLKLFNKELKNTILDTLELSRLLFPELSRHKLNIVAKHLDVNLENHHRAVDDATATADIFIKCIDILEKQDVNTIEEINILASKNIDKSKLKTYHAVILVKNYTGLRNLYELISNAHIKYFYRKPRIPKSEFLKLREGLIIGTACEAGELYRAIRDNKSKNFIKQLVDFYDYLEIQPIENNTFMVREGIVNSINDLININKKIVELGEKYNKLVVATGDVHFLEPEDSIYRKIIMHYEGFKDADNQAPLYYKTTDEMLEEFEYLGEEKAKEVVIYNTNKISDMIEKIKPIPDETFPPKIEGADEELVKITTDKAKEIYGDNLPTIVSERLEKELNSIIKNGFAVLYIIAQKLVWKSLENGYLVGSRGSVGSSFVATMAGITEVNPLSAHYVCPKCKYSDFDSETVKKFLKETPGGSGCDMPDKKCPICGTLLNKEGHDIPFETFLGFDGDKEPDIDLNFSGEYQLKAHAYTEELFGEGHVFKAGTIGTIADKTAYGYVKKYADEKGVNFRNAEINRVKQGCTGIKRTTGQHPGGIMVVPSDHSIYEFCPIQRPANDTKSNVITTHFDYHSISGRLLKLDLLGHDVPTIIRILHDTTGVDPRTVNLSDKRVLSLFTSPKALGVTEEQINCSTGSLGLPEFGTSFVRKMLMDTKPSTFGELVRISGLSHGTDVWFNNAQELIEKNICTLKDVIPTRDDIMVYLISYGVEKKTSFKIMESVRKGKGLTPEYEKIMREKNIPDWYIDSCKKIKYMFPKGHAVAYVMMTVRIGYFKIYYPYSFYAATFSVKTEDFDYNLMCKGPEVVKNEMVRIKNLGNDITTKEKSLLTTLELVNEMYARNLKFLPLDMYKADSKKFTVYDDGIMPPLCTIQGLGETVAEKIIETRKDGEYFTIEDFKERTKATKTVIELLKENKILDGIPETNQLTLF